MSSPQTSHNFLYFSEFPGNEREVEGTLSVQPQAIPVKGFKDYFLDLTPQNNERNPWFTGNINTVGFYSIEIAKKVFLTFDNIFHVYLMRGFQKYGRN